MPDEFDTLRHLTVAPAAAPADVRRAGDRRRQRKAALSVAAVVAVVAGVFGSTMWLGSSPRASAPDPAGPSPTAPSTSPDPGLDAGLDTALLTPDEIAAAPMAPQGTRLSAWEPRAASPTLSCQPSAAALDDLASESSRAGTFGLRVLGVGATTDFATFTQAALEFGDAAAASTAEATLAGWITDCAAPLGGQQVYPEDKGDLDLGGPGFDEGTWAAWTYAAPDVCTGCDAAWFTRQVVVRDGARVAVWELKVSGGPLPPAGLDAVAHEIGPRVLAKLRGEPVQPVPSPTEVSMPCGVTLGFAEPTADCPAGAVTAEIVDAHGEVLTVQPVRVLANDAEGKAWAAEHGVEYPFPNDYHQVPEGPQQQVTPAPNTVCTSWWTQRTVRDGVVPCSRVLDRAAQHRNLTVLLFRDGDTLVQLSEAYRP